jgi:hypothetical protein
MEIVSANSNFDFKSATLADPQPLAGQAGFYFTQLSVGEENKSLCLQLPECVTKQGVVAIKNAKYMDLMFERDNHTDLMRWIEKLEYTCQDIIDTKKELWFQTELTRDDIETMMTQITRLYQSGKYGLMRVFIDANKPGQKCIAYDENEKGFDLDILEANKTIIPLVMIEGVKFSSRSFEISLKLVQLMVMGKYENKSSCLIKRPEQKQQEAILEKPKPINNANSIPIPFVTVSKTTGQAIPKPIVVQAHTKTVQAPTVQALKLQAPTVQAPTIQSLPKPILAKAPIKIIQEPILAQTIKTNVSEPKIQTPIKPINMLRENVQKTLKPIIKNNINTLPPSAAKTEPINLIKKNDIEEVNINFDDLSDSISLKNPNEVYYEIYNIAREKAKQCRMKAIEAYLEAKQIKTKYMLHDLDDSEDSDDDDENYME